MPTKIEPWKTIASEIVFSHRWYTLRRDHVELPGGQVLDDYFVSVRSNVVLFLLLSALSDPAHYAFYTLPKLCCNQAI